MTGSAQIRICKNGHSFNKSSDCPVCPVCEKSRELHAEFMRYLAAPARRALENYGITTLERLSQLSEKEILDFHGIGPSSIPVLRKELAKAGLKFKK